VAVKRKTGGARKGAAGLAAEEQERLVQTLHGMAASGDYPATLGRLLAESGVPVARAGAVLTATNLRQRLSVAAKRTARGDVLASAMVCLAPDSDRMATSDQVLLQLLAAGSRGAAKARSVTELASQLPDQLQGPFRKHWKAAAPEGRLPAGIAAIATSRTLFLFREVDLLMRRKSSATLPAGPKGASAHPVDRAARPEDTGQASVGERILRAFETVDVRLGGQNYVPLLQLREALPDVDRAAFDQAIAGLRWERRLSLDAADGRQQRISPAELDAGIFEEGQTLVYAQRRHP
jgi:hypothetical protein